MEGVQLRVVILDEANGRSVVGTELHLTRTTVVEVREGYLVLSTDLVTDYDLVDVVELIPVFILLVNISILR